MNFTLKIQIIQYGSVQYKEEVTLRSRILREPLGLEFSKEDLRQETDMVHVGAYDSATDALLGCMILVPGTKLSSQAPPSLFEEERHLPGLQYLKMRQVAVDTLAQRQGVGSQLVKYAETYAREHGCGRVILHARVVAVPFYKKLGYVTAGDEFPEVGLPHLFMYKDITEIE